MYAIEVDYIDPDYSSNKIKIFENRFYAWDSLCSGNPYFVKDILSPDVHRFETIEETEEFLSEWYDFENCRFKISYLNDEIAGTKPRIVSVPTVVKDYNNNKNEYNKEGLKNMGIEIKANIIATCDKCSKQERIKEIDRNAAKLPDGWMNVSDQGIFCKECYKKYEENQKKKNDKSSEPDDDDKTFIKNLDKKIMNRVSHTLDLDDALECIERFGIYKFFYPDINSFDSDMISEMEFVSSFAMEALDRALNDGEIMICRNALKHKE